MRGATGTTAIIQGFGYLADGSHQSAATSALGLLILLSGLGLLLGVLTPLAAASSGLTTLAIARSWIPAPTPNLCEGTLSSVMIVVVAAAVVCLGPGALSIDARMFGRREVIIPPMPRKPGL